MTIAFTGHRKFDHESLTKPLYDTLKEIATTHSELTFLSGMAVGFDLAAAECVISLREELPQIRLVAVVPYPQQSQFFSHSDQLRYERVLESADEVITLAESYSKMVFHQRNDYLVANAELIIAYYDRASKGGTAYTVHRAKRERVAIQNIYPDWQLSLF